MTTRAKYTFVKGSRLSRAKADAAGRRLGKIAGKTGRLTPQVVVDDARDRTSPLHGFFEWNDGRAAEQYRLDQARHLIRSVKVTYADVADSTGPREIKAYVSFGDDDEAPYMATRKVLATKAGRAALLAQALTELENLKQRYAELEELAAIFAAIERAKNRHAA